MAQTHHFDAILFDMDGTLVDSTAGVVGAWEVFSQTYPHIDVHDILSSAHGVRTVENLRVHCGITDPDELEREAERFEDAIITSADQDGKSGIVRLPGVEEIMKNLRPGAKFPKPVWAICTSATRKYANAALSAAGIEPPEAFVAAEDVEKGKPAPDPYLLGAKRCGVDPKRCLVVEDAPAGVRSGNTAGCKTLALLTSHTRAQVEAASPTFIAKDLSSVSMTISANGGVDVTIKTE
ncbi:phosphatase [Phanerochaete sordida]|uniref:Phosphatase n=1 Tax=Phanerochaete sordida TaxID=48140 RepID=A0A9P3FXE9_9APHY|nr:phosphatase [Phanerochaete sordida]